MSKLEESTRAYSDLKPAFHKLQSKFEELRVQSLGPEYILDYSHLSFSEIGEDMLIRLFMHELKQGEPGFYVDIGAHHPWHLSNTAYFYLLGWRGINIDPIVSHFNLFEQYRPDDINLNVAASDHVGELTYYIHEDEKLNTVYKKNFGGFHKEITVPTMHINDILKLSDGKEIDFLTIDIEGHELTVLQAMDFEKYSPKVMIVEISFKSIEELLAHPIYTMLIGRGYRLFSMTIAVALFKRNDVKFQGR